MTTSFRDIVKTEKYLRGDLDPQETVLFEAKLLVSEECRRNTLLHKVVHRLVRIYHRRKLKAEVEAVHQKLFHDPANDFFRRRVIRFFKS